MKGACIPLAKIIPKSSVVIIHAHWHLETCILFPCVVQKWICEFKVG